MCVTAGREEKCWQRGVQTVKGEGLAETQGEGLPEKIKGAALAAAPKIRISLGKKL